MNPIELYKKLPKKNCGRCRQKTCMPFALSAIKGEADISECPLLTESEIEMLRKSIVKKDWREELIQRLRVEIEGVEFSEIAEGIGAELKENALVIKCLGREFIVSPDGEIKAHGHLTPWMKMLLLHYIRTAGKGGLTDKWVSFSELKAGMIKATSFQRECEEPLRECLDREFDKTSAVLIRLGAAKRECLPTKNAWRLDLLPKVPAVILYWQREEEFESKVKILFDSTADRFLDVESLIFLTEGLVKYIEANIFGKL
ncbi:MAG: DUF3786 domain-containing protein [Nitrospirae bacterium]|nr:DUF3786 domain-containing protein [Nitrospirota bacterium]